MAQSDSINATMDGPCINPTIQILGGLVELTCAHLDLDLSPHHFGETFISDSFFKVSWKCIMM